MLRAIRRLFAWVLKSSRQVIDVDCPYACGGTVRLRFALDARTFEVVGRTCRCAISERQWAELEGEARGDLAALTSW